MHGRRRRVRTDARGSEAKLQSAGGRARRGALIERADLLREPLPGRRRAAERGAVLLAALDVLAGTIDREVLHDRVVEGDAQPRELIAHRLEGLGLLARAMPLDDLPRQVERLIQFAEGFSAR